MIVSVDRVEQLKIAAKLVLQGNKSKTEDITIFGVTKYGESPYADLWCSYPSSSGSETRGSLRSDCIMLPKFKDAEQSLLFEGVQWFADRKKAAEIAAAVVEKPGEQTQLVLEGSK